ncbi:MAG: CDP-glycerol glycerophosphotransferase family protein [Clostridia bacterium]|nr:CDP-glycerol glycerophosphotransferase family protein [Clostridia bacterium]
MDRSDMVKKTINCMHYLWLLVQYGFFFVLSRFTKKYRDLWLFSERTLDARDNAWLLFRHLRTAHPEIPCAFVIDRESPDYEKVRAIGKTIQPGSFEHNLAFAAAGVKISTHIMGFAPDRYRFAILDRYLSLVKGKKVMLQHGVTGNLPAELRFPRARLDLLVCSTVPEYEMVCRDFGHPAGVAQLIGMCRFDQLFSPHEIKRQVLIMPTWRKTLKDLDAEAFLQTDYYRCINGLLSDARLLSILETYDLKAVLYLHFALQHRSSLFRAGSDRVEIRTIHDADIQGLLKESQLLITDYSSVQFDFAYMEKPLLYWQFDEEAFFSTQYGRGQFDYRRDGFGPVIDTADTAPVLDFVEAEARNQMQMLPEYKERSKICFAEKRGDHCEQTFRAIRSLL